MLLHIEIAHGIQILYATLATDANFTFKLKLGAVGLLGGGCSLQPPLLSGHIGLYGHHGSLWSPWLSGHAGLSGHHGSLVTMALWSHNV